MARAGIVTILVMAVCLGSGCSGSDNTAAKEQGEKGRVLGVTFQTMNNPFFVELNRGIQEVVEAHGDRLVTLDAQFNSLKQKNDISDLILMDAAMVFINPVNWEGVRGSLMQAKEKGTPCIIVDAPVKDADLVLSQIASDNIEAGRLAARQLAEVRRPAKVVVLHQSVNKACLDRVTGFTEELKNFPDMQIIDTQECKGTTEGARPVMLDLLGRFPEINAVFAINDPSALGAISALESQGRLNDVAVVTVDGSQEAITAILAGKLVSTSAQFPYEMGKTAAEKAYEHLEGKPIEPDIKIRVELINKDNAASFVKK